MDEKEIEKFLFSDPVGFFDYFETKGLNFKSLSELDIPKLIVKKRFPELIKEADFKAADSVFWISYFAEREIRNDIFFIETTLGRSVEKIDSMLDEMTFGEKIKFIEENYIDKPEFDNYIKILRIIKNLRNHLAHGRLDKLIYKKYFFSDPRACTVLLVDLKNAALQKDS